jgi:hypothetical protein
VQLSILDIKLSLQILGGMDGKEMLFSLGKEVILFLLELNLPLAIILGLFS